MSISLLIDNGALVHTNNILHAHGGKSIIYHAVLNGNVAILTKLLRSCGFSVKKFIFVYYIYIYIYILDKSHCNDKQLSIFVIALFKDCK